MVTDREVDAMRAMLEHLTAAVGDLTGPHLRAASVRCERLAALAAERLEHLGRRGS